MGRKKILLFIKGLGLGGAERHVVDIAKLLICDGHDVTVVYMLPKKNALVDELKNSGAEVFLLKQERFGYLSFFLEFLGVLRRLDTEIVHAHLPMPGVISRLAALCLDFRLIYTEHNVMSRLNPVTRLLNRVTYSLNDVSISCSEEVKNSVGPASVVVRNGIEFSSDGDSCFDKEKLRGTFGISSEEFVAVCVANIVPKKNHQLLVKAFADVAKSHGEARLILVGQTEADRGQLQSMVKSHSLESRVVFAGPRTDVAQILRIADLFVLSSDFEGMPLSVMEAMHAGLPVLSTRAGGVPEMFLDGVHGFLVDIGDQQDFARRLRYMILNPVERAEMGRQAFTHSVKHFSILAMYDQLKVHYGIE